MKNRVTVTVNDMPFTLVSEESEEYMQRVAAMVDERIRAVQGSGISTLASAVLAAVNIADEYLKLQQQFDAQREQMAQYFDEISSLKDECADLRRELSRLAPDRDRAPAWEERQSKLDLGEDDDK